MHHPELVDDGQLAGLVKSTECLAVAPVNILQISSDKAPPEWFPNLNEEDLSKLIAHPRKYALRIMSVLAVFTTTIYLSYLPFTCIVKVQKGT